MSNATEDRDTPVCPACNYKMTIDDMADHDEPLWDLAASRSFADIECPGCHIIYAVSGDFEPRYTSGFCQDDL